MVRVVIALRGWASAALLVTALGATARIAHADCPEGTPQARIGTLGGRSGFVDDGS